MSAYALLDGGATMRRRGPHFQQYPREALQASERDRVECAGLVSRMIPEQGLKRWGTLKYQVSRARAGTGGPLVVIVSWLRVMKALGYSRANAQLLVVFLASKVDEIFGHGDGCEMAFLEASELETQKEGIEAPVQMAAQRGCPKALDELPALLEDTIAVKFTVLSHARARKALSAKAGR